MLNGICIALLGGIKGIQRLDLYVDRLVEYNLHLAGSFYLETGGLQ